MTTRYDSLHPSGCSPAEIAAAYLNTADPITIAVGATQQIVTEAQTMAAAAVWISDNPGVASVSDSGLVTAVAPGTANLSATIGAYVASASVTVTA